jgi:anti-sigma factor RsiW
VSEEIDCREARLLVHASIDDELDAANALRFEDHLARCADCANDRARLFDLRAAIREGATRHAAPAALRAALAASLASEPSHRREGVVVPIGSRRAGRWPFAGAGFAVGAALAASIAFFVDRASVEGPSMGGPFVDGIVSAHIRALQPGHLTDVQVSDQHQVKPWFDGKVDFAPPVKDLAAQGFDLVGGRLDYVAGRTAAVVVYRRRLHLIDLFVTRSIGAGPPPATAASPNGYNVEHWAAAGQDYWAVSDLNPRELADFARAWREQ